MATGEPSGGDNGKWHRLALIGKLEAAAATTAETVAKAAAKAMTAVTNAGAEPAQDRSWASFLNTC